LGMTLDEPEDNEQPVKVNGIDVLIADVARDLVGETVVDYISQGEGGGFVIKG
jgi:Fe-S cluster assembly iron-binding protein IscA